MTVSNTKCPKGTIKNPKTEKCVLIDSRVGKRILQRKLTRSPSSKSPRRRSPFLTKKKTLKRSPFRKSPPRRSPLLNKKKKLKQSRRKRIFLTTEKNKLKPKSVEDLNTLVTLCDKLIETYDISLIDNMPDELRLAFFKTEGRKCIQKYYYGNTYESNHISGKPTVLYRLVSNYFYNRQTGPNPEFIKPVTMFIKGPKNLTVHWSERFNMHVYIFGEHHIPGDCSSLPSSNANNTMNIEDYLAKLLKNTDKYLDYLFEVSMIGKKGLQYQDSNLEMNSNSHLGNIFQKFKVCIEPVTRHADDCNLGRVHFIDVRYKNTNTTDTISFLWMHFLLAYNKKRDIIKILNNKYFLKLLTDMNLFCSTPKKLFTYFKSFIFGNNYNVSPLRKLLNSEYNIDYEVGNNIKNYIEREISAMVDKYFIPLKASIINILSTWKQIVDKKYLYWWSIPKIQISLLINSFNYVSTCLTRLVSLGPDLYLLCRMFKTFDVDKLPFVNAYPHDQPKKMNNIVIYTGDAHSQRYRRFLRLLEFKEVAKTGQSDNMKSSCIDMKYIKQPFFSEIFNSRYNPTIQVPQKEDYNFNYDFTYADF